METDRRLYYNWLMVLLININMIIFFVVKTAIYPRDISFFNSLFQLPFFIILGIFICGSAFPILISRSNSQKKNYFGYGIPILLFLLCLYFVWLGYTCTGRFCWAALIWLGVFGYTAVIFTVFYTIGIYSKKLDQKFVLLLSIIVPILLPILIIGGSWLFLVLW